MVTGRLQRIFYVQDSVPGPEPDTGGIAAASDEEGEGRALRTGQADTGGLSVSFLRAGVRMRLSGDLADLDRPGADDVAPIASVSHFLPSPSRNYPLDLEVTPLGSDERGVQRVMGMSEFLWKNRSDVRNFPILDLG